jgi:Tfp pilus assembly pilus retraction ATPase PilT
MTAKKEGMQMLDQHLRDLVTQKLVTADEAARYAADPAGMLAGSPKASKLVTVDAEMV